MASAQVDAGRRPSVDGRTRTPTKIVVAGGFGVGKTTFVGAVSEIMPLMTEGALTAASDGVDDTALVPGKTTTTVAMDFGRMAVSDDVDLYLFGTPGQQRFWFMWDDLARGAVGAVVLVDTRRLADCFDAIDYVEQAGLPFVVAVNRFPDQPPVGLAEVRDALAVRADVPVTWTDARDADEVRATLVELVTHALTTYD